MLKFRVAIHGRHFQLTVAKRKFLWIKEYSTKPVGFYTTRFVEADTANDAVETVFRLLGSEFAQIGSTTSESSMEVEEIREDEDGFDMYAPGGGYTFYADEAVYLER